MTVDQKDAIAGILIEQTFKSGESIVNENDTAASFYIIKSGSVSIQKQGVEHRALFAGESFGE